MAQKNGDYFMCVERIAKMLLATMLGLVMMLASTGSYKLAFLFQFGIIVMLLFSSFTGYCFITQILKSAFPLCEEKKKSEDKS
jgi:hypothetical protein